MVIEIVRVVGMRSAADRRAILDAIAVLPGVRRVVVNHAERILHIERNDTLSLAAILQAIRLAGYEATVLV